MGSALEWLRKRWWGLIVAHLVVLGSVYLAIWAVVEPLGVPDYFDRLPEFTKLRVFYHLAFTLLLGAYITLSLDLYYRWKFWGNIQGYRTAKLLGIQELYLPGKNEDKITERLESASRIRIMSVNAQILIRSNKQQLMRAIQRNAQIEVLIATSGSEFVIDIEEVESPHRKGQISLEIEQIETLLQEYVDDAVTGMPRNKAITPNISLGYFTTHLRSSIVICDENWAMLTLNLPPKRSVETAALELQDHGELFSDVVNHFNRAWSVSLKNNRVKKITSS